MRRHRVGSAVAFVLGIVSAVEIDAQVAVAMSDSASAYLARALDILQTRSIKRDSIDWVAFRSAIVTEAGPAQTARDTHAAIRLALERLGDRHSFFAAPSTSSTLPSGARNGVVPTGPPQGFGMESVILRERFAYLGVPAFSGGSTEVLEQFAEELQDRIARLDTEAPCGWVVDLRGNGGGNMWPMLAGLGPLVGDGELGYFVGPRGGRTAWGYEAGAARMGPSTTVRVEEPYQLSVPAPPVAVLTGRGTASSGEAIVVAFMERPNTRRFGVETAGLSTANVTLYLSDGAMVALTTSTFADRSGRLYGSVINPDEYVSAPDRSPLLRTDAVIERALAWLTGQDACQLG